MSLSSSARLCCISSIGQTTRCLLHPMRKSACLTVPPNAQPQTTQWAALTLVNMHLHLPAERCVGETAPSTQAVVRGAAFCCVQVDADRCVRPDWPQAWAKVMFIRIPVQRRCIPSSARDRDCPCGTSIAASFSTSCLSGSGSPPQCGLDLTCAVCRTT